jgi:predicted DNA-binding protein (MmcQ/YjbR family)
MEANTLSEWMMQLPGAHEDFPFGPTPAVYKVGSKIFALLSVDSGVLKLSLKCDPVEAILLRQQYPAITGGYHLNKKHWNTVEVDALSNDDLVYAMIRHAYFLVFESLKKSEKALIKRASD